MKSATFTLLAVVGLVGTTGLLPAADTRPGPKEAYLGLGVESVPSALYSQMPGTLPQKQGVLIAHVVKNSPAGKAGLQPNDIILSYGDLKVYSTDQLVRMVRADKPAHKVELGVLRAGKSMSCTATLGETQPSTIPENSRGFRFSPDERLQKMFQEFESNSHESAWDSFDAISLSRMDGNRWRAEVEYRTNEGKKESKVFTGTRDEIRKAIQSEKDLPPNERAHLLRTFNLHDPIFEFSFPPLDRLVPEFSDRP